MDPENFLTMQYVTGCSCSSHQKFLHLKIKFFSFQRLFLKVCAPQCLDYIRSPKDTTNAPSVRACIEHFNRVSLVVMATVLGGVAPDARAFIVGQWIDIAHHCRRVKNFSSLKAIVCGLQSTAVFRLRRTWEKLSK